MICIHVQIERPYMELEGTDLKERHLEKATRDRIREIKEGHSLLKHNKHQAVTQPLSLSSRFIALS